MDMNPETKAKLDEVLIGAYYDSSHKGLYKFARKGYNAKLGQYATLKQIVKCMLSVKEDVGIYEATAWAVAAMNAVANGHGLPGKYHANTHFGGEAKIEHEELATLNGKAFISYMRAYEMLLPMENAVKKVAAAFSIIWKG